MTITGKELILCILENNLENSNIFSVENIIGPACVTENIVANRFSVGVETVIAWHTLGMIKGIRLGGHIYFDTNIKDPRKDMN